MNEGSFECRSLIFHLFYMSYKHIAKYSCFGELCFNATKFKPIKQKGKAKWGCSSRGKDSKGLECSKCCTMGGGEG